MAAYLHVKQSQRHRLIQKRPGDGRRLQHHQRAATDLCQWG